MSVVVLAAPMVTRWQTDHGRIGSVSPDNVTNQSSTAPNAANIQRSIDVRSRLSITPDFTSSIVPRNFEEDVPTLTEQPDTGQRNTLQNQTSAGSGRAQIQPSAGRLYPETLGTTPVAHQSTSFSADTHAESNEEDEEDSDSDDDDAESDETEGQNEKSGEGGNRQKVEKRKSKRFRLTHNQTRFLMGEFARQTHPDSAQRKRLSKEIPGLSPRQVQVWFQNRRAKLKRLTADDREKMMRSRALPENFDMSHTLRSPFETDMPQGYSVQRQTSLSSPGIYSAPQLNEAVLSRSPSGMSEMRRASEEGSAISPMGLSGNFHPYLSHLGANKITSGSSTVSNPAQRRSLTYDPYQQGRPRIDEFGTRSASFSTGMPEHTTGDQSSPNNPQPSPLAKTESPLRSRRFYGSSLDVNLRNEERVASPTNLSTSFSPRPQRADTFPNLVPDTVAYSNTQNPLRTSSDSFTSRHQYRSSIDPSSAFIPPLQPFPQLGHLQVDTQLQTNQTTGLINQESGLDYRDLQSFGGVYSRYEQSPATAYQTPISGTTQEFALPNATDFFPLSYQPETTNMGKPPELAESNMIPHEYYKPVQNIAGEAAEIPISNTAYYNPRYRLSQLQMGQAMPQAMSQVEHFSQQQQSRQVGGLPPTPQSAGLKRRLGDGSDEEPAQADTSRKKRKSIALPNVYRSSDPSKRPSI